MTKKHSNEDSWYMQKTSLSPALGRQEQERAFEAFAAARYALRTHIHETMGSYILTRAQAAVSGESGKDKKLFQREGPTEGKLQVCFQAASQEELSSALHELGGKQALYKECMELIKQGKAGEAQTDLDGKVLYLMKLRALNKDYIAKRNDLVTGNLRLVASVIKELNILSLAWEDLLQSGAISLQKAVEAFNPSRGVQFSTYAVPVVRGDLIRILENFGHQIRLPSYIWSKVRQYSQRQKELTLSLERTPTYVEMALEMGITVEEALQMEQYQCWAPVSLDAPLGHEEGGMSLADTLVDKTSLPPGGGPQGYLKMITPEVEGADFVDRSAA